MKALIIALLGLSTSVSFAQTYKSDTYVGLYFTKKLLKETSESMGYERSIYYRTFRHLPLGEGKSLPVIRQAGEAGARNVTVEVRGSMDSESSSVVHLGPQQGGDSSGYSNLFGAIHSIGMSATFKVVTVGPDGATPLIPNPSNPRVFAASYKRLLSTYAKIAEKNGVEEFVIGTGIGRLFCAPWGHQMLQEFVDEVRWSYTGRLRIDFLGYDDLEANTKCVEQDLEYFDTVGVDLAENPEASYVDKLFQGIDARTLNGRKLDFVISRIAFTGPNQAQSAREFFSSMKASASWKTGELNLTIGIFDTNPDTMSVGDLSAAVMGKPIFEEIKSWFASF